MRGQVVAKRSKHIRNAVRRSEISPCDARWRRARVASQTWRRRKRDVVRRKDAGAPGTIGCRTGQRPRASWRMPRPRATCPPSDGTVPAPAPTVLSRHGGARALVASCRSSTPPFQACTSPPPRACCTTRHLVRPSLEESSLQQVKHVVCIAVDAT